MALCLRTAETRIAKAGLELKEAEWIWTEPHSRRLKVRCIVKKFLRLVVGEYTRSIHVACT